MNDSVNKFWYLIKDKSTFSNFFLYKAVTFIASPVLVPYKPYFSLDLITGSLVNTTICSSLPGLSTRL